MKFLHVATLFLIGIVVSRGAERTWDGSGRGGSDWTEAANWVDGIVPVPGDSLRFPFGAGRLTNTNDYIAGTDFATLTLAAMGYTLHGNRIDLSGGLAVNHSTGNSIVNLPITLLANQTFSVSQPGSTLFLNGDIQMGSRTLTFDGAGQTIVVGDIDNGRVGIRGQLRKQGTGTLWLFQPASYDAPTVVNGGTLRVDGRATNTFITINSGGTLRGAGRVGGFRAAPGGTVRPGFNTPDVLDVFGDATFNAGSTYSVRLNGPADYDQLNVRGTITLGGVLNVTLAYTPAVGDTFTIIENDGNDDITGTFAGLPEGAQFALNGRPFRISYGGGRFGGIIGRDNDVTIEAVPALAVWDGGGMNDNRWSQPLNWANDTLPWDGDDLLFASTTNFPQMVTRYDLPAGRFFSSMIFGHGSHQLQGDPVDLRGRIETMDEPFVFVEIRAPMTLRGGIRHNHGGNFLVRAPITLSADQTFFATHSNALVSVATNINLNGHQLTANAVDLISFSQAINGPGELVKTGPGTLRVVGASSANTVVEAGTLQLDGVSYGPINVKTGAVFTAEGTFHDLDVEAGGVFEPGLSPTCAGTVRLRQGSTYAVKIFEDPGEGSNILNTGFDYNTNAIVLLENPDLRVTVSDPLALGMSFPIIRRLGPDPQVSGIFRNLPEDGLFFVDDRPFSISYDNGVRLATVPNIVWDGGGSGARWSTPQNWLPDLVPLERMNLIFPHGVAKRTVTNDLPSNEIFGSLSTRDSYALHGNPIRLLHSISASSNDCSVFFDIGVLSMYHNPFFDITVNGTLTLNLEGAINSPRPCVKNGTGTLRLAGTKHNFQESVAVRSGELHLDKVGAVAISSSLSIGFFEPGTVTYFGDDQISDTASVVVDGGSRLDLNGYSDVIGGLGGGGVVDFSGRLPTRPGSLSVAGGNFGGNFVGNGTFFKVASPSFFVPDSFTLTGVNTFSGNTFVNGGEMQVDGTFANSPIRLNGGRLSGRGFVSTITANAGGGIISPGSGGMALNVALHSGSVALNAATTFRTFLTSPTIGFESHKLNVTGTVNLGGCALEIDLTGRFIPAAGVRFVIIENDDSDPIVGTFNGIPQGGSTIGDGLAFTVSYVGGDGNDVELTRTNLPPSTLSPLVLFTEERVTIRGEGVDGATYSIERSIDLSSPLNWFGWGTTTASNGVFEFIRQRSPIEPLPRHEFYRIVSP